MDHATLTIGRVARQAGVTTSAIRYYERVGVLPQPTRLAGQRRYSAETVRQLQVVDVAKRAGFSLEEVRATSSPPAPASACSHPAGLPASGEPRGGVRRARAPVGRGVAQADR